MTHKPIICKDVCLSLPHKTCFENFSAQIPYGSRIALIGRNGCGKSTLLKIVQGQLDPTSGSIHVPEDVIFGYVPQVIDDFIDDFDSLSGGQRLNQAMTQALSINPNVLLLDEPTNHLDQHNRQSLMRLLQLFQGTIIVASHDVDLLQNCALTLWHIDQGKIHIFSGNYQDYRRELMIKRTSLEKEVSRLDLQKKEMHHALMKEQERAKKSNLRGEKSIKDRKWPTIVSDEKARRAIETSGKKKRALRDGREDILEKLFDLRLPEVIIPKFSLRGGVRGDHALVSISDASVCYQCQKPILRDIHLTIGACDRIAIHGDNGSGKSTLAKAILGDPKVIKTGNWHVPKPQDIGYLDQHYGTLSPNKSVLETVQDLVPTWSHPEIRCHLNDFLFRKNEEINAFVSTLSGGEKARLSLAQIAAKTPRLLILDEITNNLDLETRDHVIQVLKDYPGALIVISHDGDFLKEIEMTNFYKAE